MIDNDKERAIAKQWLAFSKTDAYKDFIEYGHAKSDEFCTYAKEMVMPSPAKDGEDIILTVELSHSLLQKSMGCDIILSYIEDIVSSGTRK